MPLPREKAPARCRACGRPANYDITGDNDANQHYFACPYHLVAMTNIAFQSGATVLTTRKLVVRRGVIQ